MKQDLDSITCFADVKNVEGAMKLLTLKVAEIAIREEGRHISSTGFPIANFHEALKAMDNTFIRSLISYKDMKAAAKRQYNLDCSGFDSAVRHLVPRDYWEYIGEIK